MARVRIRFHVGGPSFHPVADQARQIAGWLDPTRYACESVEGNATFDGLDDVDLLVLMGLFWTGWTETPYVSPTAAQRAAFERYVASGRGIIAHHGAVASYDDWPGFGDLVGVAWVWGTTNHSPLGEWKVRVATGEHPVVRDVNDFTIYDELYYDLKLAQGLVVREHAWAEFAGRRLPMILTAEGGRVAGAGKMVYLANGHDLRAFDCPAMRQIWTNAIDWAASPIASPK